MNLYITTRIRFEVILIFVLLLFSLIGYIPYFPYFYSNIILIILPVIFIFYINRIRLSKNALLFLTFFCIVFITPYIINGFEAYDTNIIKRIIVNLLKIFGLLFVFCIGYYSRVSYNELCKLLLVIFIFNFILMTLQFFLLTPMELVGKGDNAVWVESIKPPVFWKRRVVGVLGNANAVGSFILFINVFLLDYFKTKPKLKWVIVFLSIIGIVFFAKSRNNILVGVLFLFFYLFFIEKRIKKFVNYSLCFILFTLLTLIILNQDVLDAIFRLSSLDQKINNISTRLIVNADAIKIWWNNLFWFGGGMNTETYYLDKFNAYRNYSEMLYTKMLIELGILGLIFFSIVYLYLYKYHFISKLQKNIGLYILFLVFFISFFETVFYTQQLLYFTIFIIAWLSSNNFSLKNNESITHS